MLLPVIPAKIFLVHNFFFFNDTATTEIYTLSLHDALPISITLAWSVVGTEPIPRARAASMRFWQAGMTELDRKSTRLNSSHVRISYAVFCLKKKKTKAENKLYTESETATYYQPQSH